MDNYDFFTIRQSLRFAMSKTQTLPLGGLCLLVNSQEVCVVANGAMRFGCVVPFGATHFFI